MVELLLVRKARGALESLEVVLVEGRESGFLTKYNNTRSDTHPYKAFSGVGRNATYLGAFYNGKAAAIEAVVTAA